MPKMYWRTVVLVVTGSWLGLHAAAHAQRQPAGDQLAMSIRDGFTMASVGDLIVAYPQSENPDPQFQGVLKLIQGADTATANYEGNIIDGRRFRGSGPGGFGGVPEVAPDIKKMGFRLVARSNNHMGEYGYEGMLETNKHLEDAGVTYAGSGETYAAACAALCDDGEGPRRHGRDRGQPRSRPNRRAASGPAGGQNGLRTTRLFMTPPALWDSVKNMRQAFPNGIGFYAPGFTDTDITLLGQRFRLDRAATKPYYSYEMNQADLREILAMVKEGKTRSDFMTLAIHSHHFTDNAGGSAASIRPKTRASTPTRASPTICRCSRRRRSTTARMPFSARVSTCCAASRSTRGGQSSTASASSSARWTSSACPA